VLTTTETSGPAPTEMRSAAVAALPEVRPRRVLALGVGRRVAVALGDAGLAVALDPSAEDAAAAVRDRQVSAVVHVPGMPVADAVAARLRMEPAFDEVPFVGVVARSRFDEVEVAFATGVDDVIAADETALLAARLQRLHTRAADGVRLPAIVADPDRRARATWGRVLRRAGFDVRFAADAAGLAEACDARFTGMRGCVVADGGTALAHLQAGGDLGALWVICTDGHLPAALASAAHGRPNVAIHGQDDPPENILHLVNELREPRLGELRASRRVLYGAPVRLRPAGREEGAWGMTYNLSANGFYIRTLCGLPTGTHLWLELRPPGADRLVHVEAKVVWSKPFGAFGRPIVPAGMGFELVDATAADLESYASGYRALLARSGVPAPHRM